MDINRFTEKAQEAIRSAQTRAARYSHQQIDVEHLLASLLEQEHGLAPSILAKAGVNVESIGRRIESEIDRMPKVSGPSGGPLLAGSVFGLLRWAGRRRLTRAPDRPASTSSSDTGL